MFWVFFGLSSLMMFAVTLGKLSVWFALLKFALMAALAVIEVIGAFILHHKWGVRC